MKIVFVQPNVGFKGHTWEALGIGYIIAYLRKHTAIPLEFDFYSGFYSTDDIIIKGCKDADVICFGCTSPQYKHGLELAHKIKTSYNKVIFGGIHPTVLPDVVAQEKCIDTVVAGEGEAAMLYITNYLHRYGKMPDKAYHGKIAENLDTLPFPDRDTIKQGYNLEQVWANENRTVASILSSRGCPFTCTFCCSNSLWGRKVRMRSADNILDEMDYLANIWGIDFIKFADDTFTIHKGRVLDFCRAKVERGITVPYGANAHASTIDEESIKALAESGCAELWFGVESGSPRIIKAMQKHTDIKQIQLAFGLCRNYGVKTRAYFLLGMPEETLDDIVLTEKLCDGLQPDQVGFTLLAPFPGNKYFDKTVMADWDWSTFDEYGNDWVHTETLSNQQLKEIQKRLVEKYKDRATFRQRIVTIA